MNSHDMVGLVAIVGAFVTAISCTAIYYGYLAWRTVHHVALKRDMVARGYTAKEIVAVIAARGKQQDDEEAYADVPPAKPIKQAVYSS